MLEALQDPTWCTNSLRLTAIVAGIAVVINLVFGVGMSLLLVRYEFPGKRAALGADRRTALGVARSSSGLALLLVYNGRNGWFGPTLEGAGFQMVFAIPAMVMATAFVALPLVIREVVPVLQEIGDEQEQAARSLGANGRQTFWRITLPSIKWAVVYGVVLSLARSLGEFGAVKIVSGQHRRQDPDRHPRRRAEVPELRAGHGLLGGLPAGLRRRGLHRRRLPPASQGRTVMSIDIRHVNKTLR